MWKNYGRNDLHVDEMLYLMQKNSAILSSG